MSIRYPVRLASIEAFVSVEHGGRRALVYEERRILDQFAQAVLGDIEEAWPVDTSLSRDSFEYGVNSGHDVKDGIGFTIENDVWYVQYVHYAGTPAEPALWQTLFPAVVQAHAPRYLALLKRQIQLTEIAIRASVNRGGRGFLDLVTERLPPAFVAA